MIDLKKYQELKLKGVVSLVKAGTTYAISFKKFDPDTGEIKPEEVFGVDVKELKDRKLALQKEIGEIDAFLADIEILK